MEVRIMAKSILGLGLASILATACSQSSTPQPASTAAVAPAPKPAAETSATSGTAASASSQTAEPAPSNTAAAAGPQTSTSRAGTPPAVSASAPSAATNAASGSSMARALSSAPGVTTTNAPPAPKLREVTVPVGTRLSVKLSTPVASDTSKLEDTVRGTVTRAVRVDGAVAVPVGAAIVGSVVESQESGRVKGRARIAFRFSRLVIDEESHDIRTALVAREAESSTKDDVKKGGIGAAAGAVVGGILGGGKGAAVGAGVGGTGAVVATRGKEVRLAAGDTVTATLQNALTVLVASAPER